MATKWETSIQEVQIQLAELKQRVGTFRDEIDRVNLIELIRKVAVLEQRLNELKRLKDETDRRYWQFVVLFIGGLITLGINLVVSFIRK